MTRTSIIVSLVQFDTPLADLEAALKVYERDSTPLVTITQQTLQTPVLCTFKSTCSEHWQPQPSSYR